MAEVYFHHLLNRHLAKATAELKAACQASPGTTDQKAFNIDTQIPLMDRVFAKIKIIEVDVSEEACWGNYRKQMHELIENAKTTILEDKSRLQADTGTTISTELFFQFSNKLLAIFDNMQSEMQSLRFQSHIDGPTKLYVRHDDHAISPFFHQLIDIALNYRFEKIVEKHVKGNEFTTKHRKKWLELGEAIDTWQEVESSALSHKRRLLLGNLESLIAKEHRIQTEAGQGFTGAARGFLGSLVTSARQLVQEGDKLGTLLPQLKDRVERTFDVEPQLTDMAAAAASPTSA